MDLGKRSTDFAPRLLILGDGSFDEATDVIDIVGGWFGKREDAGEADQRSHGGGCRKGWVPFNWG